MTVSQIVNRVRDSRFVGLLGDVSPRNLFLAQLLSQIGDKIWLVTAVWYLTNRSPLYVPKFLAASALPHLLLAPFAPALIRKLGGELNTVIRTDFIRGICFISFGIFFLRGAENSILIMFFLSILSNTLGSLFNPAILSLPRLIATGEEKLQSTTSLIESCFSLSTVLGPILATVFFLSFGIEGILLFTGGSYLFAAYIERSVITHPGEDTGSSPFTLPKDKLIIGMLIGFFLMNLLLGPIVAFLPLFAKEVYFGSMTSLATLETALGLGTLAGTLALAVWPSEGSLALKIKMGLVMIAASYFLFCSSQVIQFGVIGLLVLGFSLSLTNVWILNLFQTRPKGTEVLAVMSWVNLIGVASLPLSLSGLALILPKFSIHSIAFTFSLILLIGTTLVYFLKTWSDK